LTPRRNSLSWTTPPGNLRLKFSPIVRVAVDTDLERLYSREKQTSEREARLSKDKAAMISRLAIISQKKVRYAVLAESKEKLEIRLREKITRELEMKLRKEMREAVEAGLRKEARQKFMLYWGNGQRCIKRGSFRYF
jgi:hypothetical protein